MYLQQHSLMLAYHETSKQQPKLVEQRAKKLGLTVEFHTPFFSFASHEYHQTRMPLTKPVWLVHFKMRNPHDPMPNLWQLHRQHQLFYIGLQEIIAEIDREKVPQKKLAGYLDKLAKSGLEFHEVTEAQVPNGARFDATVIRLSGPKKMLEYEKLHEKLGIKPHGVIMEKKTNIRPGFEGN